MLSQVLYSFQAFVTYVVLSRRADGLALALSQRIHAHFKIDQTDLDVIIV